MSFRLPTLGFFLLLFLAACNQFAPPESTTAQLEPQAATTLTFSATGTEQTFTVPAGVASVTVEARGAPGGIGLFAAGPSGRGAVVTAELTVTPGQTLYLNVGGAPTDNGNCASTACIGGFNGGGSSDYGGGGGGASDVRTVSRTASSGSLESRLLVAAGGGGGGESFYCSGSFRNGGAGGDAGSAGSSGEACEGTNGGTGGGAGTQSAGGAGGNPVGGSGSLGQGGNGGRNTGGAGGGGLYGGGGGGDLVLVLVNGGDLTAAGGGGGGSSLDPDGGTNTLDDTRTPKITVSYTKEDQTVSFTSTAPTDAKVGGSYTPSATATSGLSVTFGTSTPTTCTFAEGNVSFVGAGECIVTADQAGDASYSPAPQVTQSFTIAPLKQDQTVSFISAAPTGAIVGGSYTPSATATSGLTVSFGTSTPTTCTLSNGTVSFIAAGTCTVTAEQAGDATYNPAAQVSQSFTISLPPVVANTYTIDLETAALNKILYSVKVDSGVVYSGTGTANPDSIRVDGYRYLSGKKLGGNQAKAISVSGDKVLTVVKAGTNTPNPTGGELDIKPSQSFGGPSAGKNGLVTLKSVTIDGVSTNGAKLILYGNGQPIKTLALAKASTQTLTLSEPGVGFIQVRANDDFTVDDVVFEVPVLQ